jgi:hypothetical protein
MENESGKVYKDERYGQYRELLYGYDKDGTFKKDVCFHGEADRVTLQQAWDLFAERAEEARKKVLEGKASPVLYYMEKNMLTTLDLSMHAGIGLWRVKRHLKPKVFARLTEKTLLKYAEAFGISIDQLKKVE